ncbi:MAG: hypothetical protein KIT77_03115 [Caldilinea sp.]|nr:hypothetical protein [Caldilinea sp.]
MIHFVAPTNVPIDSSLAQRRRIVGAMVVWLAILIPMIGYASERFSQEFWPASRFSMLAVDISLLITSMCLALVYFYGSRFVHVLINVLFLPAGALTIIIVLASNGDLWLALLMASAFLSVVLLHRMAFVLMAVTLGAEFIAVASIENTSWAIGVIVAAILVAGLLSKALTHLESATTVEDSGKGQLAQIALAVVSLVLLAWYSQAITLQSINEIITLSAVSLERLRADESMLNTVIVLISTGFALSMTIWRYWPKLGDVFFPYYRQGDCTQAGFLPLGRSLRFRNENRGFAAQRIVVPLFATSYMFMLLTLDFLLTPELATRGDYIYYMCAMWLFIMFMTGKELLRVLPLSVLAAAASYFATGTVFYGAMGALLPLAIFFALRFQDNFMVSLYEMKLQAQSGYSLDGNKLTYRQRRLSVAGQAITWGKWGFVLAVIIYSVFAWAELHDFWLPDGVSGLASIEALYSSRIEVLVAAMIFMILSLRIFGDIYAYLQMDFWGQLGLLLKLKLEDPSKYSEHEEAIDRQMGKIPPGTVRQFSANASDRVIQLRAVALTRFNAVLYYASFDILLTSLALYRIDVPGLTADEVGTLAFAFKAPVLLLFVARSISIGYQAIQARRGKNTVYLGLEKLLTDIQAQQVAGVSMRPYIDVTNNEFLLWLADTE